MKEEIFAICQLCIDVDEFCQNKDYKLTTYHFHDQEFFNTCTGYKADWILLLKHGIKEWIPK